MEMMQVGDGGERKVRNERGSGMDSKQFSRERRGGKSKSTA
jgi:hypothetical protein